MFTILLIGVAAVWGVGVVDVVLESASSGGTQLSLVGHSILSATPQTGVMYLTVLAASAVLGLAAALAFARSRRAERRMAATLDARLKEISSNQASETRRDPRAAQLFEWRRDRLLDEMHQIRERTAALRRAGLEQRASLERFRKLADGALVRGEAIPELIVIPDVDLGDEGAATASFDSAVGRGLDPPPIARRSLHVLFGGSDKGSELRGS